MVADEECKNLHTARSVLITGGCGFIGSNFINFIFNKWPQATFINYDKLMTGASTDNVDANVRMSDRYKVIIGDLQDRALLLDVLEKNQIDTIIHFAAITHVDDSYHDRIGTISDNVLSTTVLLEVIAHDYKQLERFVHISTDEVYGDSADDPAPKTENSPPNPTNPYAASKAACEVIVNAYHHSYKLPYVMVRMNNVYGPRQAKSKLIPKFTTLAVDGKAYPLMGDGKHTRNWMFVDDCSDAIRRITENGRMAQVYNIGTEFEMENIVLTRMIHEETNRLLNRKIGEIEYAQIPDRPYHDRRYHIDFSKISNELGWKCSTPFVVGLKKTIEYYLKEREQGLIEPISMMRCDG
uniref:dTDP-D-glucose 4,6-dehydratase n=1 Tax=Plectus sambesii TaxID=2011161 RepID=A0A914VWP6_9BILA